MKLKGFHLVSQVSHACGGCETCETLVKSASFTWMHCVSSSYNTVKLVKAIFKPLFILPSAYVLAFLFFAKAHFYFAKAKSFFAKEK